MRPTVNPLFHMIVYGVTSIVIHTPFSITIQITISMAIVYSKLCMLLDYIAQQYIAQIIPSKPRGAHKCTIACPGCNCHVHGQRYASQLLSRARMPLHRLLRLGLTSLTTQIGKCDNNIQIHINIYTYK